MAVNLSLLAGAGWQFFDDNGVPLSGGKLNTYAAGTTTPQATFTSSSGATANANPIILNAAGRLSGSGEIWLTEGVSYKFILTDANNVLIGTYDNISGANDFSSFANTTDATKGDALIGFRQSNSSGNLPGAVGRTVHQKFQDTVGPKDFGAAGNGSTNDTAAFTALEVQFTGRIIDLSGYSYLVNAYPTGNTYVNGNFIVGATTYSAAQDKVNISSDTDTGGIDPAFTGGVIPLPTISGRTTTDSLLVSASQNSRSEFARAVNIGSIYSWAKGNVSGNYSARQSLAWVPQSANMASEECWVWGGFRGANLASIFSGCENESNANIASRSSFATGRSSANISSVGSYAGRGGGARFTVTTAAGAVTVLAIDAAGSGYQALDAIVFFDRSGSGAGATAQVATVNGTGGITAVTILTPGSNYSSRVDATVDNGTGDFSAVMASDRAVVSGGLSVAIASSESLVSGDTAAVVAADTATASGAASAVVAAVSSTASAANAVVLGASGSTASGELSAAIAANICQATASGAVVFGRRTINDQTRSIAFGDAVSGSASTANRKFHLFADGNMSIAGTLTQNAIFTDYAEYFENLDVGVIPLGTLVSLDGRRVRPSRAGDVVLGAISATASIAAGDTPFHWSKRYLTGEFGELLYHDIPDPDWLALMPDPNWRPSGDESVTDRPLVPNPTPRPLVRAPMENPDYDPERANVSRSERPAEWSCVGLLGQVHTRLGADVAAGDYVAANDGGQGIRSTAPTNLRCMEIKSPFDAVKGYAVGVCLVK
jgi:hypothetical protein